MIRIAIAPEAFDAVAATLPLGSVGYEAQLTAKGERLIWLEAAIVDQLAAMRGPGESYLAAGRDRDGAEPRAKPPGRPTGEERTRRPEP